MDIYRIIKRVASCRSPRVRLLMLWGSMLLHRRSFGVYVDPVLACNLRCRMCAFSDPAQQNRLSGRMTDDDIRHMARGLFRDALKVQIGCGAEPTLDRRVAEIIRMAKDAAVPYVALTTNGQLLTAELLEQYAHAGLDEVTLSVHGTEPKMYEWLMDRASFDKFKATLDLLRDVKTRHPHLRLRINFTVNADNVGQLPHLMDLVGGGIADVIQIRPIQRLGSTAYADFDLSPVKQSYGTVLEPLARQCRKEGIECLMPSLADLDAVVEPRDVRQQIFEEITYCYVGPGSVYAPDYSAECDTFRIYHHRRHTLWRVFKAAVTPGKSAGVANDRTKKLNYR